MSNNVNDKEFSEGFLHDIADLLEMCSNENTDNIAISIPINNNVLNIDLTFSVN